MSSEWDDLARKLKLPDEGGGPEAALRQSMFAASKTLPDARAKVLDLSKQTGIPSDIADRNFEQITQRKEVEGLPYARIIKESPKLAEWLSNPDNAAVSKDDLSRMGWLEWSVTKLTDYGRAAASGVIGGLGAAARGTATLADVLNRNLRMFAPEASAIRGLQHTTPQLAVPPLPFTADVPAPLARDQRGPWWAGAFNALDAAGNTAEGASTAILPPPERQGFGTEVASGLGQLVPLVAASLVSGGGASALIFAAQGAGDLEKNVAPEVATQYNKDLAVLAGAGIAVGTGEIGLGLLLNRVPFPIKNAIVTKVADVIAAGGIQAGQAFAQQLLNGVTERVLINPDTPILPNVGEQLATAGATGAIARLLLQAVIGTNLPSHFDERSKTMKDLGKGLADSKAFQRAPDAVRDFIARVTKDGPGENVGIPVEKFREYFQSRNIDPAQAADALMEGGAEKFRQAALTGSDLEVPFADYSTKIMTGPHADLLNKEVRFHPGEMNFNEMEAFVKETKRQATDEAAATPNEVSAGAVREDIIGQLQGLGYTDSAIQAYAQMYESFFATAGERAGVDPKAFFEKYGLKVSRPLPDVLKNIGNVDTLDAMIDRVRKGDIPDESKLFGDSLIEFIKKNGGVKDEGGDLASREPDKVLRKGTRRTERLIQNETGLPLDTMRERAAENGYLPMESTIAEFLDKIDDELRGSPVYTDAAVTEAENKPEFVAAQSLNELSRYLKDRGIDLKALSNDQVKKILADAASMERSGGGVEFSQARNLPLSEMAGFKTGSPVTFEFTRRTEKAPRPGPVDTFAQLVEPAGRYLTLRETGEQSDFPNTESGTITFKNPLVIEYGEGLYVDTTNWKHVLSKAYGGKTGKALSKAILADGFDGIVTVKPDHVSEIVDLSPIGKPAESKTPRTQPELSVLHKLSADNLIFADQIGGLAVPSLAVVPGNMAMGEGYGDIVLIGRKDLGDPRLTPVFDADIYSSTFPRPEYPKVPSKIADKVVEEYRPFAKLFDGGRGMIDEIFDNAVNYPKPHDTASRLLRDNAAKAWFLNSIGIDLEPVIREKNIEFKWALDPEFVKARERYTDIQQERVQGDQEAALSEMVRVARESIHRYSEKDPDFARLVKIQGEERTLQHYGERWGFRGDWVTDESIDPHPMLLDHHAGESIRNAGKLEVDPHATEERLNGLLAGREGEFKQWIEDKILSMYGLPFLKIGRSKFPYNLENIVDYMTSPRIRAKEKTMTFGEGKARAAAAKRFGTLDEMRRYADMIGHPEQIDAAREEAKKAMESWRNQMVNYYGEQVPGRDFGRVWEGLDASMRAIARWARGAKTADNLWRALVREGFNNAPEDVIEQGVEAGKLFLKAPVPYFEAKPQRAVLLSEFAGAVIPQKADQIIRDILQRNKIPFREYDSSVQGSSQQATVEFRKQLADAGENVLFQPAYHGSPHEFDEFSLHKIGTGEGAQAYGWGLYFAGAKDVAEYYRKALAGQREITMDGHPASFGGTDQPVDLSIEALRDIGTIDGAIHALRSFPQKEHVAAANWLEENRGRFKVSESKGRLYKVDLPEDSSFLDYDQPIAQQSEKVRKALAPVIEKVKERRGSDPGWGKLDDPAEVDNMTGADIYRELQVELGTTERPGRKAAEAVSRYLAKLGVPGIKYLDQNSRAGSAFTATYRDVTVDGRNQPVPPDGLQKALLRYGWEYLKLGRPLTRREFLAVLKKDLDFIKREVAVNAHDDAAEDLPLARAALDAAQDIDPTDIQVTESRTRNYVVFDDKLVKIIEYYQGENDKLRRGQMRFGSDRQFNIDILRNADLSTFIHESGHFYLEVFGDIVDHLKGQGTPDALTDSQRQMQADYATLLKHFGVEERAQIGTEQHEQFARLLEAYMMEGKAPAVGLRGMMARFRSWLLNIYRSLKDLNVELTPEVRAVMDRLFASDKEIEQAQNEAELKPVFLTQRESGLDDAAWKAYQETIQDAHDKSVQYLDQKLMRELQRERAQWWKAEREKVREQVAADVYQQPEYIAMTALRSGKLPDGSEAAVSMKLDLNVIKQKYGQKSTITERLRRMGVARLEGGVSPDVAADAFGFESGEALVNALVNARPMKALIEAEADDIMRTRHGDLLLDGSLPDQAKQAIFGKHRDDVVREEMRAIRAKQRETRPFVEAQASQDAKERAYEVRWLEAEKRLAVATAEGRKQTEIDSLHAEMTQIRKDQADSKREGIAAMNRGIPSDAQIQRAAGDMLARTTIRDVRPDRYWAGARKASRAAIAAVNKGDYYSALQLKAQELLNLELYRQANEAKADFETARQDWLKMFRADAKVAATRNMDYVAAARAIAATYLFPTKIGDTLEAMRKLEAYDPDMYEVIADQVNQATRGGKAFKDLSVEEFRGLRDVVAALWTMAKRDHQVLVDGKLMARQDVQDQMKAKMLEHPGGYSKVGNDYAATGLDKAARGLLSIKAMGRRAESWVSAMDGDQAGPFRAYIWNPVKEAIDHYRVRKVEVFDQYRGIIGTIEKTLTNDKIGAPELGYTFAGRAELLGALLHSGNREGLTSNLSKLLRGRESQGQPWGTIREDGSLDSTRWDAMVQRMQRDGTLTKADFDYLQAVWDLFESLKPNLQKAHKEVYGHYFKEVPATEFETPWGTYRGGYVPAKADPFMSPEQSIRNERQALSESGNSYAFPSAGTGNTKSRVGVALPLAMNLSFIPSHIDWALRFAELQPRVKDVSKMLFDREFRGALNDVDPEVVGGMLVPWLQRAATQRLTAVGSNRVMDNFWSFVRTNSGMQAVALSVNNGLQQLTGLFIANTRVPGARLGAALWEYMHSPVRMTNEIHERSEFMRTFANDKAVELQRDINDMLLNPSVFAKASEFARRHAGIMAQFTQGIVNTVAWMGSYDNAISEGLSERDAVRRADSTIRETQGSFFPEDVSRMETGTPFMRALTMFSSYFNMQANLQATELGNTLRSDRGLTGKAGRVLSLYAVGFMMPAIVSQAIANALSGNWGDDDDGYLEEAMKLFFGSQFNTAAAMVPGFGQVGKAAYNAVFTDSSYDDDIKVSPWAGQIGAAIRDIAGWAHGRGDTKTTFKDTLSILGVLSRLPLGPLGKPLGFLMDLSSGKAQPKGPVDMTRGLVTGRIPKQ